MCPIRCIVLATAQPTKTLETSRCEGIPTLLCGSICGCLRIFHLCLGMSDNANMVASVNNSLTLSIVLSSPSRPNGETYN